MKLYKHVTGLDCIYCNRSFPLTQADFRTINKHGWGCCVDCWDAGYPNKTANDSVYIPPAELAASHERNNLIKSA